MAEKEGHIPAWDGRAQTWRRYTKEVVWYVRSTPTHKRQYCATRLLSRLTGPARLLAMSWVDLNLDHPDGVRELLQRLAASPLVRQSLPNAAAICQQYFQFHRKPSESIQSFLVREALGYTEFVEALVRLYEDKHGVRQEDKDYGLPKADELEEWNEWEEGNTDSPHSSRRRSARAAHASEYGDAPWPDEEDPLQPESGSPWHASTVPSRQSVGVQPSTSGPPELSWTDSFVLGVLRGFRLLQSSGLTPEDKRDIISTTRGSLEFDVVARALQTLWDEQFLGRQNNTYQNHMLEEHDALVAENGDWSWALHGDSWESGGWEDWSDPHSQYYAADWTDYDWEDAHVQEASAEDTEALKEAQQAEKVAESLAAEAQRTWSEAQRATAALRRDRGFGHVVGAPGKGGKGPCFICGGPHYSKVCPDRRHPSYSKGYKGKNSFYQYDYNPEELYFVGKGKGKQKGKHSTFFASKGKKGKGKSSSSMMTRPPVNAYAADEVFMGALEIAEAHRAETATPLEAMGAHQGLLDCGATASAGPQVAVESLMKAILSKDHQAQIEIQKDERPYFRFGNGRWGQALYRVHVCSRASGEPRIFQLYALPNPPDLHDPNFDRSTLVPILVGMSHLAGSCSSMAVDFRTGMAMDTFKNEPEAYRLPSNRKGHYILDIVNYLTGGREILEGHAAIRVTSSRTSSQADLHVLEFHPLEHYDGFVQQPVEISEVDLQHSLHCLQRLHEHSRQLSNASAGTPSDLVVVAIKASTPKKKETAPLDHDRSFKMDTRDPRASSTQWPCFAKHVPATMKYNPHGAWINCAVCHVRLEYIPRVGSPGQHTKLDNPAMVKRVLKELYDLMDGESPTEDICRAMQAKIDAEEALLKLVADAKKSPPKTPPSTGYKTPVQDLTLSMSQRPSSPAPSWNMVHAVTGTQSPSSEDSGPLTGADMEKLLTEEEKIRLAALLRDRKGWSEAPMIDLERYFHENDLFWQGCRVDGCVYGMRNLKDTDFIKKSWKIMTTDEYFWKIYRAKTCGGGHSHSWIQGAETARSAYYPWKLCQAIARTWRQQFLSDKNVNYLFRNYDKPTTVQDLLAAEEEALQPELPQEDDLLPRVPDYADGIIPSNAERQQWQAKDTRTFQNADPSHEFAKLIQQRQAAEEVATRTRAKRVLSKLSNTIVRQPLRNFNPMDMVMVWRRLQPTLIHKGVRGGLKKAAKPRWIGPGRVVFQELLPHQEEGDHRRHILWVLVGSKMLRCSVHSVRPVTETERFTYEITTDEDPSQWKSLADILPKREYVDIVDEVPNEEDRELPDLPDEPDNTTYVPIPRAKHKQTFGPDEYVKVHRSSPLGLDSSSSANPKVKHWIPPPPAPDLEYTPSVAPEPGEHEDDLPEAEVGADTTEVSVREKREVNDYDREVERPPKKSKDEESHKKARSSYDLGWIDLLRADVDNEVQDFELYQAFQETEEPSANASMLHTSGAVSSVDATATQARTSLLSGSLMVLSRSRWTKTPTSRPFNLQWLAIQTQPQLCARCNLLLSDLVTNGQLEHAREIQNMITEIRLESYKLRFFKPKDAEHWSDLTFTTMADQSHNNRPGGNSTGGMISLISGPSCRSGHVTEFMLVNWRCWKLKRKAIASNDAEIQAVLESEDSNFRMRLLWTEIHGAGHQRPKERHDLVEETEKQARLVKGILCTDSRGGYDAVEMNESPLLGLSNMRAALQAFQLRDNLRRVGAELRWLASDFDLADSLTKRKASCREGLVKFLQTNRWSIAFDPQFVAAKRNKKTGHTAVSKVDKAMAWNEGHHFEPFDLFCSDSSELHYLHTFAADFLFWGGATNPPSAAQACMDAAVSWLGGVNSFIPGNSDWRTHGGLESRWFSFELFRDPLVRFFFNEEIRKGHAAQAVSVSQDTLLVDLTGPHSEQSSADKEFVLIRSNSEIARVAGENAHVDAHRHEQLYAVADNFEQDLKEASDKTGVQMVCTERFENLWAKDRQMHQQIGMPLVVVSDSSNNAFQGRRGRRGRVAGIDKGIYIFQTGAVGGLSPEQRVVQLQDTAEGRKVGIVALAAGYMAGKPSSLVDMRTCELTWRALSEVLQGIGGMDVNF
ncbi:unnamed protein product [Durusdinium trenchii]|uniref:Uncharacterized protein n=1 Tax=Durusdinium trenchii TaxID=1381693 RepID=A0ABP0IQ54_9DINO